MKRISLLCIVVVLAVAGCSAPGHTVLGNWTYEQIPNGIDFTMTFASDGTWSQVLKDSKSTLDASGTYTFVDDKLTMTQSKGNTMGAFQTGRQEWSSKVRWVRDDLIEMTDLRPVMRYIRKK